MLHAAAIDHATMKCLLLSLLLLLTVTLVATAETEIFIVRHAEKAQVSGDAKDPGLSDAGQKRADSLRQMLRDAGVTAVFATEFKRTQQTAEPIANAEGAPVNIVPAQDIEGLLSRLRDVKGNALVIAHSDTIPAIITGLGVAATIFVGEADYDNFFVVRSDEPPRLLHLHY